MLRFLFRIPAFPAICNIDGILVAADSPESLAAEVATVGLPFRGSLPVVDSRGEGWVLVAEYATVSPLTSKRRWTKKEIIQLFNGSDTARKACVAYSAKSLSSKRVERVVSEVAAMIARANHRMRASCDASASEDTPATSR